MKIEKFCPVLCGECRTANMCHYGGVVCASFSYHSLALVCFLHGKFNFVLTKFSVFRVDNYWKMVGKRNGTIPNAHFHKDWQRFIKCWFNQPLRKKRRHNVRLAKARRIAPRPTQKLLPLVHCPNIKYNSKVRLGRGFSLDELKSAGIPRRFAPSKLHCFCF